MEKNDEKWASTGGWGFEAFKGDTQKRLATDMHKCFKGHKPLEESNYVFGLFRK